jgi:hypothetical protein
MEKIIPHLKYSTTIFCLKIFKPLKATLGAKSIWLSLNFEFERISSKFKTDRGHRSAPDSSRIRTPPDPPYRIRASASHRTPSPFPPFLLALVESHRHGRACFLSVWLRPGRTSLVPCSNVEVSSCAAAELSHVKPLPPGPCASRQSRYSQRQVASSTQAGALPRARLSSLRRDECRYALPPRAILVVPSADA